MRKGSQKGGTPATRSGRRPKAVPPNVEKTPAEASIYSSNTGGLPSGLFDRLENAMRTGQWLVAVFRVENEKLHLDRTAMNFPRSDLDLTSRLFVESISELKLDSND